MAAGQTTTSETFLAPEQFQGTSGADPEQWWKRFDHYSSFKAYKDVQFLAAFPLFLKDNELNWYEGLPEATRRNKNELRQAFITRYGPTQNQAWSKVAGIFQRKPLPGENLQYFISNLQHEGNLVKLPEEQIKQAILNGLSPDIRPFILQSDPQTIEEIHNESKRAGLYHFRVRRNATTNGSIDCDS